MSKNTRSIVIILVIVILVLGGALFYYFALRGKPTLPSAIDNSNIFGEGGDFIEALPEPTTTTIDDLGPAGTPGEFVPLYRRVSDKPTAGGVAFVNENDEQKIHYVERGTGHIYEANTSTYGTARITNTTIPRVVEVDWSVDGQNVVYRYLNTSDNSTIESFSSSIEKQEDQTLGRLNGVFLTRNIIDIDTSPTDNEIVFVERVNSGANIAISNTNGTGKRVLHNTPLRELLITWFAPNSALFTTKASGLTDGYSYIVDTRTKSIEKLLGEVKGLVMNPNSEGNYFIYSQGGRNSLSLFVRDEVEGRRLSIPLNTVAEKCVWSKKITSVVYCAVPTELPPGMYPDDWYKGRISFQDELWRIDSKEETVRLVFSPQRAGERPVDAIDLFLSEDEQYLFFKDKKMSHIWGLRL